MYEIVNIVVILTALHSVISSFRREVAEKCVLLDYYAGSSRCIITQKSDVLSITFYFELHMGVLSKSISCLSSWNRRTLKNGKIYLITSLFQSLRLLKKVKSKILPVYGS
jgi:hypothetical protein